MACDPRIDHTRLQPCEMIAAMYAGEDDARRGSEFFTGAVDNCLNALITALFGASWADRKDLCAGNYQPTQPEVEFKGGVQPDASV